MSHAAAKCSRACSSSRATMPRTLRRRRVTAQQVAPRHWPGISSLDDRVSEAELAFVPSRDRELPEHLTRGTCVGESKPRAPAILLFVSHPCRLPCGSRSVRGPDERLGVSGPGESESADEVPESADRVLAGLPML